MDYSNLGRLPIGLEDYTFFDCRNIHEGDILWPLVDSWDHEMKCPLKTNCAIFAFGNGLEDYISVANTSEGNNYCWRQFNGPTMISRSASFMSVKYGKDKEWIGDRNKRNRFQRLMRIADTILYLGNKYDDNAIEFIDVKHPNRKIFTVRVNLNYLQGEPVAKARNIPSQFRKELEVHRRLQTNTQVSILAGYVYGISNSVYSGWLKLGSCLDLAERLATYQTGDPLRRFQYEFSIFVDDRVQVEEQAHNHPDLLPARAGDTEWFNVTPERAKMIIERLIDGKIQ
jgi:hypothetical protein